MLWAIAPHKVRCSFWAVPSTAMPGEFLLTQTATVQLTSRSLHVQGSSTTRPAGTSWQWDWSSFGGQRLPHHSVVYSNAYLADDLCLQKHQFLHQLFIKRLDPLFLTFITDLRNISCNKSEVGMNKQIWHFTKLVNYPPIYTVLEAHTVLGVHGRWVCER